MEPNSVSFRVYKFGPFELSVEAAELRKNGVRLKLQDQPFQILRTLLEHPGETVSREELRQQLWPEGTFVDFEHGLNTAIKKIRDVLSDDAETPRYIETIPRKGYRFIAPVGRDGAQPVQVDAPPLPPPRKWRVLATILAVCIGLLLTVTMLLWRRAASSPYVQIASTRQLTFDGDLARLSAIETDGRRLFYFKYANSHLYSIPVNGGEESSYPTKFVQPVILHISPDGSLLLVKELTGPLGRYANRIWLLPTNGGPARPLGDIEAEFAAWSPDGKTIAFAQHDALYVTDDWGATSHRLVSTPGVPWWIRWSPDGQRLRFTLIDSTSSVASIWEVPRSGRTPPVELKLSGHSNLCCGIWTRDGRRFLVREDRNKRSDYWVMDEGLSVLRFRKPFLLSAGGVEMVAATASPIANTLFVVGTQDGRRSFKFDATRHQLTPFPTGLSVQNLDFSTDGKWVLMSQIHSGESVLFRARSDGSEWQPLTDRGMQVLYGRFSPDGKQVAVMGKRPLQPWKIYLVAAEGGALHELKAPITNQADPNWMPDGQSILLGQPPRGFAEPDAPRAIYIHNLLTGLTSKVPGSEGWFSPRISPDGRSFLALSVDEHKLALYDFGEEKWRLLVDSKQDKLESPSWPRGGKSAYINVYGTEHYLAQIEIRKGTLQKVISYRDLSVSPYCWTFNVAPDASLLISCYHLNSNTYALQYE